MADDDNTGLIDSVLGGPQDRVTKILTSDVPSFRDISVGIAEAMTGKGSYGLTLNKLRAQRIDEELNTAKLISSNQGRQALQEIKQQQILQQASRDRDMAEWHMDRTKTMAEATQAKIDIASQLEQGRSDRSDMRNDFNSQLLNLKGTIAQGQLDARNADLDRKERELQLKQDQAGLPKPGSKEEAFSFIQNVNDQYNKGIPVSDDDKRRYARLYRMHEESFREDPTTITPDVIARTKDSATPAGAGPMGDGPQGDSVPMATGRAPKMSATQLQKNKEAVTKIDGSVTTIDNALDLLKQPYMTGVAGTGIKFGEWVASQFDPTGRLGPRQTLSNQLAYVRAENWSDVVGKGQISPQDYKFLSEVLPGTEWTSSQQSVVNSLTRLRGILMSHRGVIAPVDTRDPFGLRRK